jgi:hypothetical protein
MTGVQNYLTRTLIMLQNGWSRRWKECLNDNIALERKIRLANQVVYNYEDAES